jgi:hypothetical protein
MEIPSRRRYRLVAPGEGTGHIMNTHHQNRQTAEPSSVLSSYTHELGRRQTQLAIAKARRLRALVLSLGCLLSGIAMIALTLRYASLSPALWAFLLVGALYFCLEYGREGKEWRQLSLQCDHFERGIARLTGAWIAKGKSGDEFARRHHLYQDDLNILGTGSLFELLCTTRTRAGADRLASYLLDTPEPTETKLRQEAVRELVDATALREQIACLGKHTLQDCDREEFEDWRRLPVLTASRKLRGLLFLTSSTCLIVGVGIFASAMLWTVWWPLLVLFVLVQLAIAGILLKRTRPRIAQVRQLTESFTVLRQGLELLEVQQFHSPKLRSLKECIRNQSGAQAVRKLEKLARAFDQRDKELFHYPSMLLAVGTQLALAVEQWRAEHQHNFKSWLDAWAEFEALQALATYAYERPDCTFPRFAEGPSVVEVEQLGHPLLSDDVCVCNDVSLNRTSRFYLVSGSNMSGKSTFLRTIGLNVVVALAGGPVRGKRARLSHLTVCASLAITDSLLEGRSKFLAEVERVSDTIRCAQEGKAVLFLIDEILSGTNSFDRRAAAEAVIKRLVAGGAIGALSTHDLALTAIAEDPTCGGVLIHMESDNPDNPLDFDYLIKPGVSRRSSASAILAMMGVFDGSDRE